MSEKLEKLGGYVVQGVDYPQNLDLVLGSGLKAAVDETEKTLTISTDETVLWEGELTPLNKTVTLSENYTNFEKIAVEWSWNTSVGHRKISYFTSNQSNIGDSCASLAGTSTTDIYMGFFFGKLSNENQITLNLTKQIQISTTSLSVINNQTLGAIYKVIGIGRKQA